MHNWYVIWIDEPGKEEPSLIEYRWKRVPFKVSCSPLILKAVFIEHLEE